MVNFWNILFLILILILFILVIILFVQNNNNNSTDNDRSSQFNILDPNTYFSEIKKDKDVLIHCSSTNQNILTMSNNLTNIYNHIDFISLTDISKEPLYELLTNSNKSINYASYNNTKNDYIINSNSQIMQGFIETRHLTNYHGVSLKIGYPTSTLEILKNDESYSYIRQYTRYIDKKSFYFVQIKINKNLNNDNDKYKSLSNMLSYIKKNYSGDFMFVGNFNVQGHEFVFENYFSDKKYLICPFYQTLTGNDSIGLTAYDGIVVSKNLYNSINYKIEFCPGDNIDRYMIIVELIYSGFGTIKNNTSILFKKYIETIIKNLGNNRKNYINDKGTYSPNNIIGDDTKVSKINLSN